MKRFYSAMLAVLFLMIGAGCGQRQSSQSSLPLLPSSSQSEESTSPRESFTEDEIQEAQGNAQLLAQRMARYCLRWSILAEPEKMFSDAAIQRFFLSYLHGKWEADPYTGMIPNMDGKREVLSIPAAEVERAAWELFGKEAWSGFDQELVPLGTDRKTYAFNSDVWLASAYLVKEPAAQYFPESQTIEVTIQLFQRRGFLQDDNLGPYRFSFRLMEKDGRVFLRFTGFRPLEGAVPPLSGDALGDYLRPWAQDIALHFPYPFEHGSQLDLDRYLFWRMYYANPLTTDNGAMDFTVEEVDREALRLFGAEDYTASLSDEAARNLFLDKERQMFTFHPVGEAPWLLAELVEEQVSGDEAVYTFDLYDRSMGEEHPGDVYRNRIQYRFQIVTTAGGEPQLMPLSAVILS